MKRNVFAGIATISAIICLSVSSPLTGGPGGGKSNLKLSDTEVEDLMFMREEEKLARDSYIVLLVDLMITGDISMMHGLEVGANIEDTDIEDIHAAIDRADHEDIIETYESLVCGSRNHLRAFVGQIEMKGGSYEPILLPQEEFDAIVDTPTERDCGSSSDDEDGDDQRGKRGKGRG